jgi:hypothetical protein
MPPATSATLKRRMMHDPERIDRLRQMHVTEPLSADDIFWMQVDLGRAWLSLFGYTGAAYDKMRDSPVYWEWVRTMWELHDLQIIRLFETDNKRVDAGLYWRYHRTYILERYPNTTVMTMIFGRKRSAYVQ